MIVSRQNRKIKDIRRLMRCKADRAVLEGPHLIDAALTAGCRLDYALATPSFLANDLGREVAERLNVEVTAVDGRLFDELCDTDSPRGILAVGHLPRGGIESLPRAPDAIYLFIDGVQDPGNLGALVRVAEAFRVTAVALAAGSAHPNHPRALRASAGSLLRCVVAVEVQVSELADRLAARWLALGPRGGIPPSAVDATGALVLALGAEGPGLSPAVLDRADQVVTIPMSPRVESLNVTAAAAVALYEISRLRACDGPG